MKNPGALHKALGQPQKQKRLSTTTAAKFKPMRKNPPKISNKRGVPKSGESFVY
jgi:hypothetical protein